MEDQRFTLLFETHYDSVLRYAWRRVPPSEVEDVVGEVFAVAWRRIADVPAGHELPWLYVTARHVLANRARAAGRREDLLPAPPVQGDPAEAVVAQNAALTALRRLDADDRELLLLIAWEGLDARAVAEVLGISTAAVHVRLHRARKRLERHLSEGEPTR